jgi:DNA-binding transcriptional ArsR family regulator
MLRQGPVCVCEITAVLDLAPSTVSKHLSILKSVGLILDEKDGRWVNYRLASNSESEHIDTVMATLETWLTEDATMKADESAIQEADRNIICSPAIA